MNHMTLTKKVKTTVFDRFLKKKKTHRDGWEYAKEVLGQYPTEEEVDRLFDKARGTNDPFDEGIISYCRHINWGVT